MLSKLKHISNSYPLVPFLLIATLIIAIFGGYQGLSLASEQWLVQVQKLAFSLNSPTAQSFQDALHSAHPHLDLIGALWLRLLPLSNAALSLTILSSLATLIAITSLWRIISRLTHNNTLITTVASLHFLLLPATISQLQGPSVTMLALMFWLVTWDMCTLEKPRWWHMGGAWIAGGIALGSWSPMLLWAALLLLASLQSHTRKDAVNHTQAGTIQASSVPAYILLCVPLVPLVATITHPGLLTSPKDGWLAVLSTAWLKYPLAKEGVALGGHWYEMAKVPFLTSLLLSLKALPLTSLLLGIPGALYALHPRHASAHTKMLIYSILFMLIALWAVPGAGDYGSISQVTLMLAPASMLVACGLQWVTQKAKNTNQHKALALAPMALSIAIPALTSLGYSHGPTSWSSSITGGPLAEVRRGDSQSRHTIIPEDLVQELVNTHQVKTLGANKLATLLEHYNLPETQISTSLTECDAALLLPPRFTPDTPQRPQWPLIPPTDKVSLVGRANNPLFVFVNRR